MSRIDVTSARADLARIEANWERGDSAFDPLRSAYLRALDELEALRKPERPDVAAWREELARIDAAWAIADGGFDATSAFHDARALLDKALSVIDAGWPEPTGDVVSVRDIIGRVRDVMRDEPTISAVGVIEEFEREANKIPLRTSGAITDEMVEEAAKRAYDAPLSEGPSPNVGMWDGLNWHQKTERRNEARAVLEYAASRGVAPASPVSRPFRPTESMLRGSVMVEACARARFTEEETIAKLIEHAGVIEREQRRLLELTSPRMATSAVDTGAAERLTRYRCAIGASYYRNRANMRGEYASTAGLLRAPVDFDTWLGRMVEVAAHAMLAAEKEVPRG